MQRLVDTSVAIVRGEEKHRRNPYQSHRDEAEPRERNDRREYVAGKGSKAEATEKGWGRVHFRKTKDKPQVSPFISCDRSSDEEHDPDDEETKALMAEAGDWSCYTDGVDSVDAVESLDHRGIAELRQHTCTMTKESQDRR